MDDNRFNPNDFGTYKTVTDMPAIETVIDTHQAISRMRRGAWLSMLLRVTLLGSIVAGFVLLNSGQSTLGAAFMAGGVALMFLLAGRSVRTHQQVGRASALIGAGQYDEAERTLAEGLRSFILYRKPRLGMLQNLAALRHAQRRFREASLLALELLRQRRTDPALQRALLLMQAECALEMNDLPMVHQSLSRVGAQLRVREMLKLMELQVEYCVRIGAFAQALEQLPTKIELAELLPADAAAQVQALLALSARRVGRADWSDWLRRRAELLTDIPRLLESRPILRELWS